MKRERIMIKSTKFNDKQKLNYCQIFGRTIIIFLNFTFEIGAEEHCKFPRKNSLLHLFRAPAPLQISIHDDFDFHVKKYFKISIDEKFLIKKKNNTANIRQN